MVTRFGIINKETGEILGSESSPFDEEEAKGRARTTCDRIKEKFGVECEVKSVITKWTCGECYTMFDLPQDRRCPTCRIYEIVPMSIVEGLEV